MEEKQEFQLGDVFYYVYHNSNFEYWYFVKDIVKAVEKNEGVVYLKGERGVCISQRKCGHTSEEAKEITLKYWKQINSKTIRKIKDLFNQKAENSTEE